jgi:hypothetical protein
MGKMLVKILQIEKYMYPTLADYFQIVGFDVLTAVVM